MKPGPPQSQDWGCAAPLFDWLLPCARNEVGPRHPLRCPGAPLVLAADDVPIRSGLLLARRIFPPDLAHESGTARADSSSSDTRLLVLAGRVVARPSRTNNLRMMEPNSARAVRSPSPTTARTDGATDPRSRGRGRATGLLDERQGGRRRLELRLLADRVPKGGDHLVGRAPRCPGGGRVADGGVPVAVVEGHEQDARADRASA